MVIDSMSKFEQQVEVIKKLKEEVKMLRKEVMGKVFKGMYEIPSNLKVSIESVYLLNGLLQFYPNKRLNWDQIVYHPFFPMLEQKVEFLFYSTFREVVFLFYTVPLL